MYVCRVYEDKRKEAEKSIIENESKCYELEILLKNLREKLDHLREQQRILTHIQSLKSKRQMLILSLHDTDLKKLNNSLAHIEDALVKLQREHDTQQSQLATLLPETQTHQCNHNTHFRQLNSLPSITHTHKIFVLHVPCRHAINQGKRTFERICAKRIETSVSQTHRLVLQKER